jgi:hypothetical protein
VPREGEGSGFGGVGQDWVTAVTIKELGGGAEERTDRSLGATEPCSVGNLTIEIMLAGPPPPCFLYVLQIKDLRLFAAYVLQIKDLWVP